MLSGSSHVDIPLKKQCQERHHYLTDANQAGSPTLEEIKKRDKMKQELANKAGITLISIPFWWDNRIER